MCPLCCKESTAAELKGLKPGWPVETSRGRPHAGLQGSSDIPDGEANVLQIRPQNSTSKINKSILLPTLRLRLQLPQTVCLRNSPECGQSCDPFPDKNLSMFCIKAAWVQVQGKAQNGKAQCLPAPAATTLGLFFQELPP